MELINYNSIMFIKILKTSLAIYLILVGPFLIFNIFTFSQNQNKDFKVALVLGAGVYCDRTESLSVCNPSYILQERLDSALEMYNKKEVVKILVSGDNRRMNYNEPQVMYDYLISKEVPPDDVIADYAGRRTVDSCWRAKNVFKLDNIVVVTQLFHIPRSTFLCNSVGLEVKYKIAGDAYLSTTMYGVLREIPASWKVFADGLNYKAEVGADGREEDLSRYN